MPPKYQYFNGLRFTRDDSTGYYLCATKNKDGKRQRMHIYVWEHYNGKVPDGYHVHHMDKDKSNNNINNLELLTEFEHLSLHGRERADLSRENILKYGTPKAAEWHGSKEGREWHKKHYEKMKKRLYQKQEYTCQVCGKKFVSTKTGSKFCSNNCKAAFRRKSGIDNETRKCIFCGKEFTCNKYSKQKYCSRDCGRKGDLAQNWYHRGSK